VSYQWALAVALHQLATIVWIGGMFFAHMALRPAVGELLEAPQRLPLMLRVFARFFAWVWAAVILLWVSGSWIFLDVFGGQAGLYIHAMMGIGSVMTLLFAFIWFVPYRRMKAAVAASDWPAAAGSLALIRAVILTNLVLGLIAAVLGVAGPKL
jgi:uncharacterized membrane protein